MRGAAADRGGNNRPTSQQVRTLSALLTSTAPPSVADKPALGPAANVAGYFSATGHRRHATMVNDTSLAVAGLAPSRTSKTSSSELRT